MSVYLDASVLLPLVVDDPFTEQADAFLRDRTIEIVVGDFAAAEFASAVGRKVRMNELSIAEARAAFSNFDAWTLRAAARVETAPSDIAVATTFLRRLDLPLRTPDALNPACLHRY